MVMLVEAASLLLLVAAREKVVFALLVVALDLLDLRATPLFVVSEFLEIVLAEHN